MIIKDRRNWIRLLFSVRGSSLAYTWKRIAFVTGVSVLVTMLHGLAGSHNFVLYSLTPLPFTLIGVALGVFLGFRNNASYDRFWEGRRLWGGIVNASRSFARQSMMFLAPPEGQSDSSEPCASFQRELILKAIAYPHALRCHLRSEDPYPEIARFLTEAELASLKRHSNTPLAILQLLGERLRWAWQQGWIHDLHYPDLAASLTELTALQGGCERIKSTPIPFSYTVLIHRIVGIYCLSLPFGIMDQVGMMTPFVTFLIAHAFFGLDAIGDEIEEPFGLDPNDLPLSAISRTIEINLLQLLGEETVPEPIRPINDILP